MVELEKFTGISADAKDYFARNGFLCMSNFLSVEKLQSLQSTYHHAFQFRRNYSSTAVQRFQPVSNFEHLRPCLDLVDAKAISDLGSALIDTEAFVVPQLLGAWTSNSRRTYVLPWHRDIRDNSNGFDYGLWEEKLPNREYFLQFNLPVFDDASFWVVPGSGYRQDTSAEASTFAQKPVSVPGQERFLNPWVQKRRLYSTWYRSREYLANRIDPENRLNIARNEIRLQQSIDYAKTMPNAVEVKLKAGDIMFYRGCSWHTAIYRADVERFTFFSNIRTKDSDDWYSSRFLPSHRTP